MRVCPALLLLLASSVASAQPTDPPAEQPLDPYATPAPPPGAEDPVLAEQIAQALVHRAQELYDARVYVDAKQLAV